MKDYIEERVLRVAQYIVDTGETVRQAAKVFRVSKSTVHKDLDERLPELDAELFERARAVLLKNKAERHLRGGEATRGKYIEKRRAAET